MNKTQLIDELATRFEGNKKAAAAALDAVVDTVTRTVAKGEKVGITGFGVFEKVDKPARMARNPATGQRVRVKKTSVPRFKPGTGFKDVVSGAKKLPKVTASAVVSVAGAAGTARRSAAAAKSTAAGRSTAKKATATRAGATRTTAKKTTAKKAPAKRAPAKKAPAKTAAKKAPARKTTTARKTTAKRTTAKKAPARRTVRATGS